MAQGAFLGDTPNPNVGQTGVDLGTAVVGSARRIAAPRGGGYDGRSAWRQRVAAAPGIKSHNQIARGMT